LEVCLRQAVFYPARLHPPHNGFVPRELRKNHMNLHSLHLHPLQPLPKGKIMHIRLFCKNRFRAESSCPQGKFIMKKRSKRTRATGSIRLFLFFSSKQTNTIRFSFVFPGALSVGSFLFSCASQSLSTQKIMLPNKGVHLLDHGFKDIYSFRSIEGG
jgi:hypothetical protein